MKFSHVVVPAMVLVATAGHLAANLTGRELPYATLLAIYLLMPGACVLAWALLGNRLLPMRSTVAVVVSGAIVSCLCLAIASWHSGVWGGLWKAAERCALVPVLFLAGSCLAVERALKWYLLSLVILGAIAIVSAYAIGGGLGHAPVSSSIGGGNINWLIAPLAVGATVWWTWIWLRRLAGEPVPLSGYVGPILLLVMVVILGLATGRRGAWLVVLVGPGSVLMTLLYARSKMLCWGLSGGLLVLLVALAWVLLPLAGGVERGERLHYVRSAYEVIQVLLPFGGGGNAALFHQSVAGEWSRHFTATGVRILSFHNEVLDLLAETGLLGVVQLAGWFVVLLLTLRSVADRVMQGVFLAAVASCICVGMLDNAWSQMAGAFHPAVWLGLLAASARPGGFQWTVSWIKWFGWLVLGCSLVSLLAGLSLVPAMMINKDDSNAEAISKAKSTWSPMVLASLYEGRIPGALSRAENQVVGVALEHDRTMGMGILPPVCVADQGRMNGDATQEAAGLLQSLTANPFSGQLAIRLLGVVERNPSLRASVDARTWRRCLLIGGVREPPVDEWHAGDQPWGIEPAADAFAEAAWMVQVKADWVAALSLMRPVVEGYGDVPEVALFTVYFLVHASDCDPVILCGYRGRLINGLRTVDVAPLLDQVVGRDSAKRLWPFMGTVLSPDAMAKGTRLERSCARLSELAQLP